MTSGPIVIGGGTAPDGSGLNEAPRWSDGWQADAEPRKVVALWWCLRAAEAGVHRAVQEYDAFEVWTSAVEAVWWTVALDDGLREVCGTRYTRLVADSQEGQILKGVRWLRHRHAHEVMVTATGGPAGDFFGRDRGQEGGPAYYLSPTTRWKASEDVYAPNDQQPQLRPFYAEHVGRRPLEDPIRDCIRWLAEVMNASGLHQPEPPRDPTVLR